MVSPNIHTQSSAALLAELSRLYGVLPDYRDSLGRQQHSPVRSIYQALAALGARVDADLAEAGPRTTTTVRRRLEAAIGARREELWKRVVDPTLVFWEGGASSIVLRLPAGVPETVELTLLLEGGSERSWVAGPEALRKIGEETIGRRTYAAYRLLKIPRLGEFRSGYVPMGYHRLCVAGGGLRAEAAVFSAPRRCWAPPRRPGPQWGVFAPLYALGRATDWGAGDLADLERLAALVGEAGGSAVATLPLLAAFLDRPFEPAPYRPVSRLFWNEFYLAVEATGEWAECPAARELWSSAAMQSRAAALRAEPLVDYAGVMALKRRVLHELCDCFFAGAGTERRRRYAEHLAAHPQAEGYAHFRARVETEGSDWRSWEQSTRDDGVVPDAASRESLAGRSRAERYHLYCQWQIGEQMGRLSEAGRPEARLFLDVPVGVHPGGFDTWRWHSDFLHDLSMGAPPDAFFALGQNWDSPPLHPECLREQGFSYMVSYVREQMRHAHYLRIDHFMALHRLFCTPVGSESRDGVYISYPAEEQYAVLSLESHRNQTIVVGEDLGTVPPEVRTAMRRHGVLGTWVMQLFMHPRTADPVPDPSRHVIATINTHDTFPLAGFVRGDDIRARVETGQADESGARRELAARRRLVAKLEATLPEVAPPGAGADELAAPPPAADPATAVPPVNLLFRALARVARSRPALLLVNLEDLWGETRPQNLPGTGAERSNWQRKMEAGEGEVREAIRNLGNFFRG